MSRRAAAVALVCAACGRLDFDAQRQTADARATDAPPQDTLGSPLCAGSGPALVGCWPFDGDTLDYSGQHHDATAISIAYVPGHDAGSAVATNADTQLLVAESASLDLTTELTVEMWIYTDQVPPAETFLFDNDDQYGLGIGSGGNLFTEVIRDDGSAAGVTDPAPLTLSVWHHVALRYAATTTVDILVDGAVVGSAAAIGPLTTHGGSGSRIAGDAGAVTTPPFIGLVDDVRVWSVVRATSDL